MFTGIEILYNLLWLSMIVIGAVTTIYIMKNRDPHDDGPSIEDDDDTVDGDRV